MQIEFLDGLVEEAIDRLGAHGDLAQRRSGEFNFRGVWVYFNRLKSDLVALVVEDVRYELPLF